MKVLVFDLTKGTSRKFNSIEEAAQFYQITPKCVERQIITGGRWKGLTFDILDVDDINQVSNAAVGQRRK